MKKYLFALAFSLSFLLITITSVEAATIEGRVAHHNNNQHHIYSDFPDDSNANAEKTVNVVDENSTDYYNGNCNETGQHYHDGVMYNGHHNENGHNRNDGHGHCWDYQADYPNDVNQSNNNQNNNNQNNRHHNNNRRNCCY